MSDTCILNYADGGPDSAFRKGQRRLEKALKYVGFQGDSFLFNEENRIPGAPPHCVVPYGFKPYAMKLAQAKGYRFVFWCDSSVYPEKSMDPAFEIIRELGYLFLECGADCGTWCTDIALQEHGVSREQAFQIKQIIGGCQGLDLQNDLARTYLDQWYASANDGVSFQGPAYRDSTHFVSVDSRVKGHRHDQVISSIIAWQLGMKDIKPDLFIYDESGRTPRRDTTIFICSQICPPHLL